MFRLVYLSYSTPSQHPPRRGAQWHWWTMERCYMLREFRHLCLRDGLGRRACTNLLACERGRLFGTAAPN